MPDVIDTKETKPKWIPPRAGMGRPKGSKNKFTTNIKEAILESFQKLGGADYLEEQGRKNPVAYLMLLKTVMPLQVAGVDGQPIVLVTGVVRDGDDVGDHVGQIEHSAAPPTIEAKPEPLPPTSIVRLSHYHRSS